MQRRSDIESRKTLTLFNPSKGPPKGSLVTCDPDIRYVLMAELNRKFCDPTHDLILQEFGCKGARIDIAVVNGSLHGFEIKSDSETQAFGQLLLISGRAIWSSSACRCRRTLLET
jgi:hypothetical protein